MRKVSYEKVDKNEQYKGRNKRHVSGYYPGKTKCESKLTHVQRDLNERVIVEKRYECYCDLCYRTLETHQETNKSS